jgi:hypothetical protein
MGRPKGSLNKPKNNKYEVSRKNDTVVLKINMEKQIAGAPLTRDSNRGWINFGERNMYPLDLSTLYYNSIVHKACVDFCVTAIIGEGIDYDAMKINDSESVPNYGETWDVFLEKICLDYVLYGSYAFQIIKNKDEQTYSYYHEPISNVRCEPKDEDGVIKNYYISSDWTNISKYPPIKLPRFGFQDDEEIKSGQSYLFVYESYLPDMEYYYSPNYVGALKAIQTEIELIRFDLRAVLNNFSASGVLALNRIEDDNERRMVLDNIQAMFTGSDAANSLMITFKNNDDDVPVSFTKIDKDVNNVDLFNASNDRNIDRIVAAHRIPSKQLIGISSDNAMLGGTGNELNVAYNLYNKTIASRQRNNIVRTINRMLSLNGIDTQIILKPLTFNVTEPTQVVERINEDTINEDKNITDTSNIEEKRTNENNDNVNIN